MICVRVAYFLTIAHSLSTGQSTHLRASAVERIGNGKRACIDQSDSAQKKREVLNLAQSRVCGKFTHGGEVSQTLFTGNLLFSFALGSPPRDIRKASVPLPHSTFRPTQFQESLGEWIYLASVGCLARQRGTGRVWGRLFRRSFVQLA